MRALVVHDRPEVLEEIASLVEEELGSRCVVDRAKDMVEGRDLLKQYHYDLAVIDLTIPAATGIGDTGLQHADWLLNQAFAGTDLKTPADVIGISRDDGAIQGIRNTIGEHVLAVICEDPDGEWRKRLSEKIAYTRNTRRSRLLAANSIFDLDIALITALDEEVRPYEDLLELSPCEELAGAREFVVNSVDGVVRRGIVVSVGRSGQAPAAAMTQAVLTQFRPRIIMMTGFCGGVEGKLQLGDVAVFKSATPWDYGKWIDVDTQGQATPKFLPRGELVPIEVREFARLLRTLLEKDQPFELSELEQIRALSGGKITQPKLRGVAAGSGSSVVTSTNTLGRIVQVNDGIHAVDMESYGFYHACRHTPVPTPDYVCIKGVADFCNGEKGDEFHESCSRLSAWLAVEIIRRHYDFAPPAAS